MIDFNAGVISFSVSWDALQAAGTFFAAGIAWFQISSFKRQQKGWETLKACERYESDPILDACLRTIREVRKADGGLPAGAQSVSVDIITILNYLDGLAIGVRQGFYDAKIVRDHLEPVIRFHVDEFLDADVARLLRIKDSDFRLLRDLVKEWDLPATHFGG